MNESEKAKRKRLPDPWWRFPQRYKYTGKGAVETLIPHLQGYNRYEWRGGEISVEIEELESDQAYRFVLTYNAELSSGSYQAALSGHISQMLPDTFVIEGMSTISPSGLINLVFYVVLIIFISIPVAMGSLVGGGMVMAVLSTPMLFSLVLHLWQRWNVLKRFEQILRHYVVYGPHVVLDADQQPAKRKPLESLPESLSIADEDVYRKSAHER